METDSPVIIAAAAMTAEMFEAVGTEIATIDGIAMTVVEIATTVTEEIVIPVAIVMMIAEETGMTEGIVMIGEIETIAEGARTVIATDATVRKRERMCVK